MIDPKTATTTAAMKPWTSLNPIWVASQPPIRPPMIPMTMLGRQPRAVLPPTSAPEIAPAMKPTTIHPMKFHFQHRQILAFGAARDRRCPRWRLRSSLTHLAGALGSGARRRLGLDASGAAHRQFERRGTADARVQPLPDGPAGPLGRTVVRVRSTRLGRAGCAMASARRRHDRGRHASERTEPDWRDQAGRRSRRSASRLTRAQESSRPVDARNGPSTAADHLLGMRVVGGVAGAVDDDDPPSASRSSRARVASRKTGRLSPPRSWRTGWRTAPSRSSEAAGSASASSSRRIVPRRGGADRPDRVGLVGGQVGGRSSRRPRSGTPRARRRYRRRPAAPAAAPRCRAGGSSIPAASAHPRTR